MNLKGRERNREMVNALFNEKAIKSGVPGYPDDYIPNKIYYIVVNGSKEYFMNENKARSVAYDLKFESPNVSGPYEETDPEEIAEVIDAGIIRSSHKPIKSSKPGIDGGTVFETEVLMPKAEFNKWKRAVEKEGVAYTVEYDFGGIGCYMTKNGLPKHIGTWFPDTETLACDDVSLFGNYIDSSRRPIKSSRYYTSHDHWKLNTAVIPVSKKMVMSFFEDGTWDWNDTVGIYGKLENSNNGRVTPAVIFGSSGTYEKLEKGRGLFNDQSWNDIGYFNFIEYMYDDEVFEIPNARYFVLK